MLGIKMRLRDVLLSGLCCAGLSACFNNDEAAIQTTEPAIVDIIAEPNVPVATDIVETEPPVQNLSKILPIGQRQFDTTYTGDFDNFVCTAIKETLEGLPNDIDIISQARRDDPFDVFRLDILIDALRDTELPFLPWEIVPVGERNRAAFSARMATIGRAVFKDGYETDRKNRAERYKFQAFEEPHFWDKRHFYITYDELMALPDTGSSEHIPIRRYRLNEHHTLYDIKPVHPIKKFSQESLLDWDKLRNPYFGSKYYIYGPSVSLWHPFKKGNAEVSLGSLSRGVVDTTELIWDNRFLYAISIEDKIRYNTYGYFSIKVTKFDPTTFAKAETLERNIIMVLTKENRSKVSDSRGEVVDLCTISLKLKAND